MIELFPDFAALQRTGFAGLHFTKPAIMIAMTARTGSTQLCALLEATAERIVLPGEIFNSRGVVQTSLQRFGVRSFAEYLRALEAESGPIFIFKTCWVDLAPFADFLPGLFPRLRIAYLDRRDVIAQAVSLMRAQLSGEWHRPRGWLPPDPAPLKAAFNAEWICRILDELEAEKTAWAAYFARLQHNPPRLWYEDFARDHLAALGFFRREFGLALDDAAVAGIGYEKLGDALSEDWVDRIRRRVFHMS